MLSRKFGMNNDTSPISNVEYNINVNVAGTNSSPDDIAEAVMKSLKRKERMVGAVTRV
jgi:Ni,Fe-hydrogenase III small subunit